MLNNSLVRGIIAGLVGCLAMLAVLFIFPLIGAPPLDVFGMFSTFDSEAVWWFDPLETLVLGGIIFPTIYSQMLYHDFRGKPWQRGLIWGLILWSLRGCIVMPLMGEGFFSVNAIHPIASVIQSLLAHVIYGVVLGALTGHLRSNRILTKTVRESEFSRR